MTIHNTWEDCQILSGQVPSFPLRRVCEHTICMQRQPDESDRLQLVGKPHLLLAELDPHLESSRFFNTERLRCQSLIHCLASLQDLHLFRLVLLLCSGALGAALRGGANWRRGALRTAGRGRRSLLRLRLGRTLDLIEVGRGGRPHDRQGHQATAKASKHVQKPASDHGGQQAITKVRKLQQQTTSDRKAIKR